MAMFPSINELTSDIQAGGGIVNAMRGMNALTQSNLNNRILQSEAEYAPYTNYANALSKIAYSQFVGPQTLASILTNPAISGNLSRDQFNNLLSLYQNQMSNIGGGLSNVPVPKANSQLGHGLLSMLINKLSSQPQSDQQNPLQQNISPASIPTPNQQAPISNMPVNQPTRENVERPTIGYQTPATEQAQNVMPSNTMGAGNPAAAQKAIESAQQTAVTGQAETQNKLREKRSILLSNQAMAATNAMKSLEGFHRNYLNSAYKGQYAGSRPSSGIGSIPTLPGHTVGPEQSADRYSNQYLNDIQALSDSPGGQTDMGRDMLRSAKFARSLDPDAEKESYDENKSKLNRLKILRHFGNVFYKNNPSALDEELVALMNEYNEYAPPYDYKSGKSLPENDKKFKDFTSKEALESYRKNGYYDPYENKKPEKKVKVQEKVKIYKHPKLGNVTEAEIEYTAKKHHKTVEQVKSDLGLK